MNQHWINVDARKTRLAAAVVALIGGGALTTGLVTVSRAQETEHKDKTAASAPRAEAGHKEHDDGDEHDEPKKEDKQAGHDEHEGHDHGDEDDEPKKEDKQAGHDEHEGHDHGDEPAEAGLTLSSEERRNAGVVIAEAGPGDLKSEISMPGEVALNEDHVVHVVPLVGGVVREVRKTVGDSVKTGEQLATLASRDVGEGRLALLTAQVQASVADAEVRLGASEVDLAQARVDIATTKHEWQQDVHENTARFLARLREGATIDELIAEFKGKAIGESRARLLSGYAAFHYTRTEYERESGLRQKEVSSEADLLLAQKEYGTARAQFVASLDDIAFQNRLDLLEKKQALEEARQQLNVVKQQLNAAQMAAQASRLGERTARGALRIMGLTDDEIEELLRQTDGLGSVAVRAPIDGVVLARHLTVGELVGQDSDIFTVADLSAVWVNLTVYLKDLEAVRTGQDATIRAEHSGREAQGRITMLSPTVNEETRTATARVVMDNDDGSWRPGVFVVGRVSVSAEKVPVVVPKNAVQTVEGKQVVFVPEGGAFEPVPVQTGRSDRERIEITAGLAPGTSFVAEGAYELKAKLVTSSLDSHAGHGH